MSKTAHTPPTTETLCDNQARARRQVAAFSEALDVLARWCREARGQDAWQARSDVYAMVANLSRPAIVTPEHIVAAVKAWEEACLRGDGIDGEYVAAQRAFIARHITAAIARATQGRDA